MKSIGALSESLVVDEFDIACGVFGSFRLKSFYQPIFSRAGGALLLTGLQGMSVPCLLGQPVATDAFRSECTPEVQGFVSALGLAVQLHNYGHTGIAGLDLHVDCDPCGGTSVLSLLSERYAVGCEDVVLGPEKLVCEVSSSAQAGDDFWDGIEELRWKGVRLAGSFGADRTLPAEAKADVVRIESAWFRKICNEPTARLLGPMISVMRSHGAKVLIGGIETAHRLRIALEAGADHFQGDFLAEPVAAGCAFDEAPLSIAALLGVGQNVVSFRR
ncbi:EAL domain-containing protein [Pseudaminobacter soli (ex Li et al. 2025)]|uniref:EAL domain-containing protein n=1 Tax=Pseudaminobacter soli (ex Li et al. 2025) TaxID=1295366 RepID=A0A2P7S738_9HYPH|nr:EAL domain-containing protein [Mesorhizobium soli]PSJ58255.1 hypothetical protein C7I85_20595 [Mesorhizobium soli]